MAKRRNKGIKVQRRYYEWRLYRRKGIYYADSRGEDQPEVRRSLGTDDYDEALDMLDELDFTTAINNGLASHGDRVRQEGTRLELGEGRTIYEEHLDRPQAMGGVRSSTKKRYRPILDKFLAFCENQRLTFWNQIDATILKRYISYLEALGRSQATVYIEGNTIKQIVKYFVGEKHLPPECTISLRLRKQRGTSTYCYTRGEVTAIIGCCDADKSLHWLRDVVIALVTTGLRISELASLRWSDLTPDLSMLELTDESGRQGEDLRTTKTGRGRTFPVNQQLREVLLARERSGREIFNGPRGGRLKPDTVLRILHREVLKPLADNPPEGVTSRIAEGVVHSFRHYFCSVSANSGTPEPVVMRWLGHRDSEMVQRYYHLHDKEAQRHMSQLDFFDSADGRSVGNPS